MKKTTFFLAMLALCGTFALTSCGDDEPEPDKNKTEQGDPSDKENNGQVSNDLLKHITLDHYSGIIGPHLEHYGNYQNNTESITAYIDVPQSFAFTVYVGVYVNGIKIGETPLKFEKAVMKSYSNRYTAASAYDGYPYELKVERAVKKKS